MGAINPFLGGAFDARNEEARIEWVAKALCLSRDPEDLFVRGAAQRKATGICRDCPVRAECLELSLQLGFLRLPRDPQSKGRMKVRSYLMTQPLSSRMRSASMNSLSTPKRLRYLS